VQRVYNTLSLSQSVRVLSPGLTHDMCMHIQSPPPGSGTMIDVHVHTHLRINFPGGEHSSC